MLDKDDKEARKESSHKLSIEQYGTAMIQLILQPSGHGWQDTPAAMQDGQTQPYLRGVSIIPLPPYCKQYCHVFSPLILLSSTGKFGACYLFTITFLTCYILWINAPLVTIHSAFSAVCLC